MTLSVLLCRFAVFALMLVVWRLLYMNARSMYRMPPGKKKVALRFGTVFVATCIFLLQASLMQHGSPDDAYGNRFLLFVVLEAGGGIVTMFYVVLRDRAGNSY